MKRVTVKEIKNTGLTEEFGRLWIRFVVMDYIESSIGANNLYFTCYAEEENAKKVKQGIMLNIEGNVKPFNLYVNKRTIFRQIVYCENIETVKEANAEKKAKEKKEKEKEIKLPF